MKFEEFYSKYFGEEKGDFYKLSKEGYLHMKKSVDPLHDNTHIENLLGLLNNFLIKNKKIKKKLNLEALFLSICWHDTWKSKRNPKSIAGIIYGQTVEGILSAKLLKKASKKYLVDKNIVDSAAYAIRKHNTLQFTKRKTLEAKLLKDIDKLDAFNYERFVYAKEQNFNFHKRRHFFLLNFYMTKISRDTFNFSWTKDILKLRRKNFVENFKKELNKFSKK